MTMLRSWLRRLAALLDKSAWLLIAPALIALYLLDPPLARTFAQWSLFFLVLAGMAVVISRIVFPQVDLTGFVRRAAGGDRASATVAAAIVLFVGILILSGVIWVKGS